MTNQEAIEVLKKYVSEYRQALSEQGTYQSRYQNESKREIEADELAIAALEKQEPMKPEKIEPCNNGLRFGWCPKCNCSQVCETANYCKTCGQALKWERK